MFHVLVRKNRTAHQRIDVRKRSTGGGFAFACGDKFDYGQTVIKRPKEKADQVKLKKYLELHNVQYEEVKSIGME